MRKKSLETIPLKNIFKKLQGPGNFVLLVVLELLLALSTLSSSCISCRSCSCPPSLSTATPTSCSAPRPCQTVELVYSSYGKVKIGRRMVYTVLYNISWSNCCVANRK